MEYFRGDGSLTKEFLINIIKSKIVYQKYLPDGIKLENLIKDFLFSLIVYVDPAAYSAIYDLYKQKTANCIYKKWNDYKIDLKEDMLVAINEYVPSKI